MLQAGVGVGVVVGTVATCLLFVMGITTVKVLIKLKEKKKGNIKNIKSCCIVPTMNQLLP